MKGFYDSAGSFAVFMLKISHFRANVYRFGGFFEGFDGLWYEMSVLYSDLMVFHINSYEITAFCLRFPYIHTPILYRFDWKMKENEVLNAF